MHSVNSRNAPFGAGNRLSARSPAAVDDMAGTAFRHTNASATVNASVFMRNYDVVDALSGRYEGVVRFAHDEARLHTKISVSCGATWGSDGTYESPVRACWTEKEDRRAIGGKIDRDAARFPDRASRSD